MTATPAPALRMRAPHGHTPRTDITRTEESRP